MVNKEHRKDSSGKKLHRKKKKVAISRTLEKKRLAEPSSNRAGSSKEEFKKLLHKAIDLDQLIVIETEMLRGDASEPSNEKERDATVARIEDYAMQNSEKLYEIEKLVLQQLR